MNLLSVALLVALKIMPAGDSITYGGLGGSPHASYRGPLYTMLTNAGVAVDYVGSLQNPNDTTTPDKDQEGHPSWYTFYLSDATSQRMWYWVTQYQPDIVLLIIGTNDAIQDHETQSAPEEIARLVRETLQHQSNATVIVSLIPPTTISGYPGASDRVNAINAAIPSVVAWEKTRGGDVRLVDPGLTTADLQDGTHPNAAGNLKIANAFFAEIMRVVNPSDMSAPMDMSTPVDMAETADMAVEPAYCAPQPDLAGWGPRPDGCFRVNGQCVTGDINVPIGQFGCSYGGEASASALGLLLVIALLVWRKRAALAIVALLMLGGVASADKAEPVDVCTVRVFDLEAEVADLKAEIAKLKKQAARVQVAAKYKLGDTDEIDLKTFEIKRAPKPAPKK
jgi:MYXO-CTERM domain-containing protein